MEGTHQVIGGGKKGRSYEGEVSGKEGGRRTGGFWEGEKRKENQLGEQKRNSSTVISGGDPRGKNYLKSRGKSDFLKG